MLFLVATKTIVILIILIIIALIAILIMRHSAKKFYNQPFLEYIKKNPVDENKYSDDCKEFVIKFNYFYDLYSQETCAIRNLKDCKRKIFLAFIFILKKNNELKNQKELFKKSIEELKTKIDDFNLNGITDKSNVYYEIISKKLSNGNLDNQKWLLFFKKRCPVISKTYEELVFYKHYIIRISNDISYFECKKLSDLFLNVKKEYFTKDIADSSDEVVKYRWLHEKKKGGPDLRYSYNPRRCIIVKYDVYFSSFPSFVSRLNFQKEVTEVQDAMYTLKRMSDAQARREGAAKEQSSTINSTEFSSPKRDFSYNDLSRNNENQTKTYKTNDILKKTSVDDALNKNSYMNQIKKIKYIKTLDHGCGAVVNCNETTLFVQFWDDVVSKSVDIKNDKYQILSEAAYNSELREYQKIKEERRLKKIEEDIENTNVEIGIIVNHSSFGKGIVSATMLDKVKIDFIDGEKVFDKRFIQKEIYYGKTSHSREVEFNHGDILYNEKYGYGLIVYIDERLVDIYWKHSNSFISVKSKLTALCEKVYLSKDIIGKIYLGDIVRVYDNYYFVDGFLSKKISCKSIRDNEIHEFDLTNITLCDEYFYEWIEKIKKDIKIPLLLDSYFRKDYYTIDEYNSALDSALSNTRYKKTDSDIKFFLPLIWNTKFNLYLKKRYDSFDNYLKKVFFTEDYYYYDYSITSLTYNSILEKLSNQRYILKVSDSKYLTIKKMGELGISSEDFFILAEGIEKIVDNNPFVTVHFLKSHIDSKILELVDENKLILDLIKSFGNLKIYKINGTHMILNNDVMKSDYVEEAIITILRNLDYKSMDVYDLIDYLNDNYYINYNFDSFSYEIKKFKFLFYSEETEKIYINKDQYYEEVF